MKYKYKIRFFRKLIVVRGTTYIKGYCLSNEKKKKEICKLQQEHINDTENKDNFVKIIIK